MVFTLRAFLEKPDTFLISTGGWDFLYLDNPCCGEFSHEGLTAGVYSSRLYRMRLAHLPLATAPAVKPKKTGSVSGL
jgi:hypothetical protein